MRHLLERPVRPALLVLAAAVQTSCGPQGQQASAAATRDLPDASAGAARVSAAPASFARFDVNEDGWLSGNELDACDCAGRDTDGDQEVTRAEFAAGAGSGAAEASAEGAVVAAAPAAPQAPAPAEAPPAGGAPPAGYYECYFYGHYGLQNSSMVSMRIHSPTEYEAMEERGRYSVDTDAKTLRMRTGSLAGRVAHLRESDGKPAIVFIRKENEVGGRPTIDISDTWCYHEPG